MDDNRDIVMRFMMGTESGDFESIASLVHDDFMMEWPQSGERFSGRDNAFAAMRVQKQKPEMSGEPRLVGSGDVWVMMVPLRYGDEILHYVAVIELDGGKVRRATGHWGAPFPAQDYRAEFADRS